MSMSKKISVVLSMLVVLFSIPFVLPEPSAAFAPRIILVIGRSSRGCRGVGLCAIVIGGSNAAAAARKNGRTADAATQIQGEKVYFEFSSPLPEKSPDFTVEEDTPMDAATAKSLGYQSVTILKGSYPIDAGKGRYGAVTVNAKVVKSPRK